MPLTGQPLDIQIIPQNQQAQETAAPVGRIKSLINGIATKFEHPPALTAGANQSIRIEKRAGFRQLTTAVAGPHFGDLTEAALSAPTLLDTLGTQLVDVDDANPCVLAANAPTWERFPYALPTQALSMRPVYANYNQIAIPDAATVGDVSMFTWTALGKLITDPGTTMAMILDANGTPIAQPTVFSSATRAKVASDGLIFYLFAENAGVLTVSTISKLGANIGGATFGTIIAGSEWDVTFDSVRGVVVAWRNNADGALHVTFVAAPFGVVALTDTHDASINSGHVYAGSNGVAWLTNDRADGFVYLVGREVSNAINAWQINGSGVATHSYTVAGSVAAINACGFVAPTGNADLTIWLAVLGASGNPFLNQIQRWSVPLSVAATLAGTIKAQSLSSRAFRMAGHYYCATYYQSVASVAFSNNRNSTGQPTYFFHAMDGNPAGQMCGRFEYARAALSWQTNHDQRDPLFPSPLSASLSFDAQWHLSSTYVDSHGALHISLGYEAETFSARIATTDAFLTITAAMSTVGIRDYILGAPGQGVEYAGELLLPGPGATSFTGYQFTEHGVALAPEKPASATGTITSGGGMTINGQKYSYVFVFEWTQPNGDRARSATSIPFQVPNALTGSQNSYTIVGTPCHVTTRTDMIVSVYRNFFTSSTGVLSADFRKVSNDLLPLLNDTTADTFTFVDVASDAAALLGEPLYTTPGVNPTALQRDPCPAFRTGTVFQNRVFVIGWDGYIWYSGEKTPGEALWFNIDVLKISMPTSDPMTALAVMDNRLVIFCANSIWFITGSAFPDGNGQNGNVPTPLALPFSNGSTGFVQLINEGVVYSRTVDTANSVTGGVWLLTRDLRNVQLSGPSIDDLTGRTIGAIVSDVDQRLICAHDQGAEVLDTISEVWSAWTQPSAPLYAATWGGRYTYADATGAVWTQDPTRFFDANSTPIITTLELQPLNLAGVRNYKRIWQLQFFGKWIGDHDLTVTITYYDETGTATSAYAFTPNSAVPYEYEPPLARELVRAIGVKFVDSFPRGASAGFQLESLGAYVAVEKGLNRLPTARKIVQTG